MSDAATIARALHGKPSGSDGWWSCRCPSHEDHAPSLSLKDGDTALLLRCHAGCDPRDILAALRSRGLLEGRGEWREPVLPRPKSPKPTTDAERTALAMQIWASALDPRASVVETYLARRGLALDADLAGRVIRYHPRLWHSDTRTVWPGMVGLMTDLRTDRPTGIHRTFLRPDGSGKAPVEPNRKMLGRCGDSAVKLDRDDFVELGLCACEGIETGLAARALGYRPLWALGSAGAIAALPVLGGIEALTVLGENNDDGQPNPANAAAVKACIARWTASGVDVELLNPVEPGDAADVWLRRIRT